MRRFEVRLCIVCAIATALIALLVILGQASEARAADAPLSFINDIAPILKENCYSCHDAKKKSGKLNMTSYATLRTGGANDDPIVPGKPDESEIVGLLRGDGERMMPPKDKGGPLPKAKIQLIETWIKQGAKLDEGIDSKADVLRELRKRWQPPMPPETYAAPFPINALAFSPDGERLIVGGYFELTVWELPAGKLVQRIRTRAERTYGMAFLPNGLLAVAGGRPGQEGDVRIYDLAAPGDKKDGVNDPNVLVAHLFDTDDCVLGIAVSKDGQRLAACGCDRAARVWDLSAGVKNAKLVNTVETHADWVLGVAFSPDGNHLLTASRDKTGKSYDLTKKESAVNFADHQATVFAVAARGDGKAAISVGADKGLCLWKIEGDNKPIRKLGGHTADVVRVIVHPTQPIIITASADKTIRTWKDDGQPQRTIGGLSDVPFALAISPDGSRIAAAGYDGVVRVMKLPNGEVVGSFVAKP